MADETPLTNEERAELEKLRAEKKAAREQAQAQARERRELERLKEEKQQQEAEAAAMRREAELREKGRELMEPDEDDLKMPLGQKIVLALVALIAVVVLVSAIL